MRIIEVEEESANERWLLWMVAGAAIGVTAGVLAAEKFSGRRPSARGLLGRALKLARTAATQWGPMLQAALEIREALSSRGALRDEDGDRDDDAEDEYEDADEYAAAEAPAFDDDLDEDDLGEEQLDEDDEESPDPDDDQPDEVFDSVDEPLIGERVLEAFINDPILAERNVEIEADDDGEVVLTGSVRAPKEVAHAVTIARGVPGVTAVRQRLKVVRRR